MNYLSLIPVELLFKKIKNNLNNPKESIRNALTKDPEIFELIGQRFALAQFERAYSLVFLRNHLFGLRIYSPKLFLAYIRKMLVRRTQLLK